MLMLSDIAAQTDCRLVGDDCQIDSVADITQAEIGQLVFINNAKYLESLKNTKASAVVMKEAWLTASDIPVLLTDNPRLAFAKAAILLHPEPTFDKVVADSACVSSQAKLASSVTIEDYVVIRSGCELADDVHIGAGSVLAENVVIGKGSFIHPNVTLHKGIEIGENCIIHSGCVIGTDGFGFIKDGDSYLKIPQLGSVKIGNNVDIGANSAVDRGALLDTIIADGVKIDNQVQVAHNVEIGRDTVISAKTGIAGTTKIGKNCLIGGGVGLRDNIEVCDDVVITGRTFVSSSIKEPGFYSSSVLVDTTRNWKKNAMRFKHLDAMAKRLNKLEKKLGND